MELKDKLINHFQDIVNGREGRCGDHGVFTPQLNSKHVKELLIEVYKMPSNKIDPGRQKACLVKHEVYKKLTDLTDCPVCGKAFYDWSTLLQRTQRCQKRIIRDIG
jgi:hypothetical protein